ncbi:MAG: tetratricopeptide repeat protein [Bacteroidetes bacterium]|nr:MAG: tetratricopeptide repeat protein [Bacteroidota bacterium]
MAKKQRPNRPLPKKKAKMATASATQAAAKTGTRWEAEGWLKWALIAMAITAACYIPSLDNQLVNWDDDPNITENPNLQVVNGESLRNIFDIEKGAVIGNYNPLPIFTFALEKMAAGEINTTLIHFDNLLLHLLTVFFAMRLLLHMGLGVGGAFIGGLLFGIHPMRVESVAWATERKDVLFAVFYFAALMYYVRWIKIGDTGKRMGIYLLMALFAILSGFSKVQAVSLPLSMLVLDYWFRQPLNFKRIWEKAPFWLISLAFGLVNIYTLGREGSTNDEVTNFNFLDRLCIGAYSFCVYIYKLFIPYPMSPLYPYPRPLPIWVYLSPILFVAIWYGIYRLWKQDRRMWVFGMVFFFFNVMFVLQVLGAGQGFLADRFTYVPYFGFFALAGWLYQEYAGKNAKMRNNLNMVAAMVFLIFGIWTVRQIDVWQDGGTLWTHVMKYEEDKNSLPYWNRGQFLRGQGKYDLALQDYTKAITIEPKNPELHNSRGKTYFDMAMGGLVKGQEGIYTQKAIEDFNEGLSKTNVKPKTQAEMLINRGAAQASLGKYEPALKDLNEGITIEPANKNGYLNRSLVYFSLRQYEKAIEDYSSYLELDPYNANIWYERGMLRRSLSQSEDAITDLNQALQLNPNLGIAYMERARAYAQLGNKAAAQQDYQRAAQFGRQMEAYDQQLMSK